MNFRIPPSPHLRAFSLVEVVLALAICSFVLVALLGLLSTGLQSSKDSEDQIQAANLASMLVSTCQAAPKNTPATFGIPSSALTNGYTATATTAYIGLDGITTNVTSAAYLITYRAGTNTLTGANLAQLYLMLSWPPQANPNNATVRHYELSTYIPLP